MVGKKNLMGKKVCFAVRKLTTGIFKRYLVGKLLQKKVNRLIRLSLLVTSRMSATGSNIFSG